MTTVLHLSSAHPPFDTRVFYKECRTLADAGYEVTLAVPGGPRGRYDGVQIVPVTKARSRLERVTRTQLDLWRIARSSDADVIHFHDPDIIPMGVVLSALGRTVIFDSHEDVIRQLADRSWIPPTLRRPAQSLFSVLERLSVRRFSAVVSAEPEAARRFVSNRVDVIQNFPLPSEFNEVPGRSYAERDPVVFYVGGITRARGARQMVDAIGLLPESLGARFVLAGGINEPGLAEELSKSPGWARTEYLGFIGRDELRQQLGRARVGLVLLQPTAQYREATQPVKLFEYMAAGLPVVASDFHAWRPFVAEVGSGLMVDPTDVRLTADALARLLQSPGQAADMGMRGRQVVLERWTWDSEATKLVSLYEDLVRHDR